MELADVTDSKLCSPHAVRNLKAFEIQGFPETKNPTKPAPTSKSTSKSQIVFKALSRKHLCRRDGIGRRVGLKIQWANHPCGFDPRRRHHPKVPKALILLGFRDFSLSFSGQPFLRPEPWKRGDKRVFRIKQIGKSLVPSAFPGLRRSIGRSFFRFYCGK